MGLDKTEQSVELQNWLFNLPDVTILQALQVFYYFNRIEISTFPDPPHAQQTAAMNPDLLLRVPRDHI